VVPVKEKPNYMERAWQRIREEVEQGHQAYVVAPRISADPDAGADADLDFSSVRNPMRFHQLKS
jgi:ATP-dependent DNA helicase RecG